MSKSTVVCGCALVLLVVCGMQQVGCLHLRKHPTSHSADQQAAHSTITKNNGETESFNRYQRFNRLHVCDTDLDCVGRNRPSCCASSPRSSIRMCQPLSKLGNTCNTFSRPHMWSGERLGMQCPCEAGLECVADSSSSYVNRGTCM